MALRKFLFMNATEGYQEEQQPSDSLGLGGLTMSGNIAMGSNKVTGLGAGTTAGDALAYGQAGASLNGLTSTGNIDLNSSNKVINSAAPTNPGDLATKSYVDTLVVTGGQIKEAIASEGQLSNAQGIRANEVLFFANQPVLGDSVTFKNASLTRTYTFVANIGAEAAATDVSLESDALTAMQRLVLRANADAGNTQWALHVDNASQRLNPTGNVIMVAEKTTAAGNSTSRIYGTFTTTSDAKVTEFASGSPGVPYTDYTSTTVITMPTVDPGAGRFGFRRQVSALVDGEMHFALDEDTIWSWDSDLGAWQQFSGSGAIPDATSGAGGGTKGKLTVDEDYALYVASGILRMSLASAGGLQFNAGSPKTLGVKLDTNPGLSLSGSGLKGIVTPNKGLTVTATGFEAVPDTTRGVNVDASGLYIDLAANPGLQFTGGKLDAKVYSAGGLQKDGNGLSIKNNPAGGLTSDGSGEKIVLEATTPTLQVNGSNELGVKLDPARAITTGASGIGVNLETTNPALAITTNKLDVKKDTTRGLDSDAAGLFVKVDGTTLSFNGGGQLQSNFTGEAQRIENSLIVDSAVSAGEPVTYTSVNNRVVPADTDTDAHAHVVGVARTAQPSAGSTVEVVTAGPCAGVLAGAVVNTPYYLATGGGLTTSLPSSTKRVIQVGFAMNANDLFVQIIDRGKKA